MFRNKPVLSARHQGCSTPLKVCHVIPGLFTGGAETMLYRLLRSMDRSRFDPVVVSLIGHGTLSEQIEKLGMSVYFMDVRPGRSPLGAGWRLVRLIRQLKPDLIQGWMYHGNLAAQLAATFLPGRVPVVWNIRRSLPYVETQKPLTSALVRLGAWLSVLPRRIIYNSQLGAEQHELTGYRTDRRIVIPNGFACKQFRPDTQAGVSVRIELGLAEETPLIGLVANYRPVKDHVNFLEAAKLLLQENSAAYFLLVGRGVDGANMELATQIEALGLKGCVHLLGERRDIPRLTAALDIASSSSLQEGFPNTVGEAMACGVPCVVTDVGDSAAIVGETGIVVRPKDPQALAVGWAQLLNMSREERLRLGCAARQRVVERYSLEKIVKQYEDLYESLATGGDLCVA